MCAVCREPITYDLEQLCSAPRHQTADVHYKPDQDMLELQKKMAALYVKQKEQGGIIDIEAESNKFLIDISVVSISAINYLFYSLGNDLIITYEKTKFFFLYDTSYLGV